MLEKRLHSSKITIVIRSQLMPSDEYFMQQALNEAKKALKRGEVPVGAVIISGRKILARGYNSPIGRNDPTAHAEIIAIRKAGMKRKNYRLGNCDLYVTVEPCAMCLGAAVQARIRRLVFGAFDPKAGAVASLFRFPLEKINHRMEVKGGVMEEECGRMLKDFFKMKRTKKS